MATAEAPQEAPQRGSIRFEPDIRKAVEKFGGDFPPRKIPPHLFRPVWNLPGFVHAPDADESALRDDWVARFIEDVGAVVPGGTIRIFETECDPRRWNHPLVAEALSRAKSPEDAMHQHAARGETMLFQGRYQDAVYDYTYVRFLTGKYGFSPKAIQAVEEDEARQILQQTLGGTFNNYGFALMRLGQFEEALQILDEALRFNPSQIFVNNNMADCFKALGYPDVAREHYQREVDTNPTHPTAQQSLDSLKK